MRIMTIKPAHAAQLRTLAERDDALALAALPADAAEAAAPDDVVGGTPGAAAGGELNLAGARFAVLGSSIATAATPAGTSTLAPDAAQAQALKVLARDLMLPAVKEIWPTTGEVVTGTQLVWAGVEFWQQLADEEVDGTELAISGVKVLSSAVGLALSLCQAPAYAQTTNTVAGLIVATAGKLYAVRTDGSKG
jgi:hypothetical protein